MWIFGGKGTASEAHQEGQCGWGPGSQEDSDEKGLQEAGHVV